MKKKQKERNLEGYVITLQFPSLLPFLLMLENRELRKELAIANGKNLLTAVNLTTKISSKNWYNFVKKSAIVRLQIFFADYVLEERMAKSPQKVLEFLNELLTKAKTFCSKKRCGRTFRFSKS